MVFNESVRDNFFTGTIPATIANWQDLQVGAAFYNTNLTGSIPSELCDLPMLGSLLADCEIECSCCDECF